MLLKKFEEQKDKSFENYYKLGKVLGEGNHAQVFQCFKVDDLKEEFPFAVKVIRENDEEKKQLLQASNDQLRVSKLQAFMSTPKFLKVLTDLSRDISKS